MKEEEKNTKKTSNNDSAKGGRKSIAEPHDEHHVPTWLLVIIGVMIGGIIAGGAVYTWQRSILQAQLTTAQSQANATVEKVRGELENTRYRLTKKIESLQEIEEEKGERFVVSEVSEGNLLRLDETWDLYINEERGFSIEIPRYASDLGSCAIEGEPYEGEKQDLGDDGAMTEKMLPIDIFASENPEAVSIAATYQYRSGDEGCKQIETTATTADKASPNLAIYTQDLPDSVEDHADALDQFAANRYGEACAAGSVSMMGEVTVETSADAPDGETCQMAGYVFVYDEELDRAATFDYGQDIAWRDFEGNIRLPRNLTLR